jgi:hypothetical protein
MSPPPSHRSLPAWVEPLCVMLFCVMAVVEHNRGERFWSMLFVAAALGFSVSSFIQYLRQR